MNQKQCKKCNQIKDSNEFYSSYSRKCPSLNKRTKIGFQSWCKVCSKRTPESQARSSRKHRLKKMYGITEDIYNSMLIQQNYKCQICLKHPEEPNSRLVIDHSHQTGLVRGLLCSKCNAGIGLLCDKMEILEKAINYLKKYQ